ncbi:MAG: thiol-disulfide oxidoreductase DCC family protein [Candidatus Anammoxibacter sp.]
MTKPVVLIYDAECSLCCACMRWIKLHAGRNDDFEFIECQSEARLKRFPNIKQESCLAAFHLVTHDKRILIGNKSLPEIVSRLRNLRWLAVLFRTPVINSILFVAYKFIANNRFVISRTIWPLMKNHF